MTPPISSSTQNSNVSLDYTPVNLSEGVCEIPVENSAQDLPVVSLQQNASFPRVDLFGTCQNIVRSYLRSPTTTAVSIATFNTQDDYQRCVAQRMNHLLETLHFEERNQSINPKHGIDTIYEDSPAEAEARISASSLSNTDKNMLRFFMYGGSLSQSQLDEIFQGENGLVNQLMGLGMIVQETRNGNPVYRLNNLTMESHRLPNASTMYLLSEIPSEFKADHSSSSSMISTTSFILLHRIEQSYANGNLQGVIADMGSGNGIQSIALLMMNPGIEQAIATEVDQAGINLSRWNTMLNGVETRFTAIDNSNASFTTPRGRQSFDQALHGRHLSLAVSNPPFNIVPRCVQQQFPGFGAGGETGLDITNLFMWQILPHLDSNAEFLFYSQLAADNQDHFFLERSFNAQGRHSHGFDVNIERADFAIFDYGSREYSEIMERILAHFPNPQNLPTPPRSSIYRDLRTAEVNYLHPAYVSILPQAHVAASMICQSEMHLPLLESAFYRPMQPIHLDSLETPERPGGVFETIQHTARGGVFLEEHEAPGGVYIQHIREPNPSRLEELFRQFRQTQNTPPHRNVPARRHPNPRP